MEKKNDSGGSRLEKFFAGKGFYIVLFLCVAVIGVSTWILLAGSGEQTDVDYPADIANNVSTTDTPDTAAPSATEAPVVTEPADASEDGTDTRAEAPEQSDASEDADSSAVWSEGEAEEQASGYYIWPLAGEVENGYSDTSLVYNKTMADWRTHEGLDISADIGTQVMAVGGGTVESVYTDDLYGTTVVISHNNGLKSIYCNLAETPTVYEGDNISAGEIIGAVGDTALCETGEVSHLHLAMTLNGASVDPTEYLPTG